VYPDRLIALQGRAEIVASCGNVTVGPDGTHGSPPCLCTAANGTRSKWIVPESSATHIGRSPVWLPYFYWQLPQDTYPGRRHIGYFYSTPARTRCLNGQPLGTAGCTWRRLPPARIMYPAALLAHGWNATTASHWPLRTHGPNTTAQTLHNIAVFGNASSLAQAAWLASRCCGC